jgi:hypothetical protein
MNFVIALRQFQSQFGCDYAAAAVGWIARYTDFHSCSFHFADRWPDCHIRWPMPTQDSDIDWYFDAG